MLCLVYMLQHPSCNYLNRTDGCQFRCSCKWSKTTNCQLGSCVDITSRDLRNPSYQLKDHKHSGRQKAQHAQDGILICQNNSFCQGLRLRPCRSQKHRNSCFPNPTVGRYISLFLLSISPEIRYRWQAVCNSAFVFFSHPKRFIAEVQAKSQQVFPFRPTPAKCDRTICMFNQFRFDICRNAGRTQAEDVWRHGAEGNICGWTWGGDRQVEKNSLWRTISLHASSNMTSVFQLRKIMWAENMSHMEKMRNVGLYKSLVQKRDKEA